MYSPFLTKMRKKHAQTKYLNINLGHFKDLLIQHLIATRAVPEAMDIIDIDFAPPGKGTVGLTLYYKPNKETAEDQVSTKTRGKKRS